MPTQLHHPNIHKPRPPRALRFPLSVYIDPHLYKPYLFRRNPTRQDVTPAPKMTYAFCPRQKTCKNLQKQG